MLFDIVTSYDDEKITFLTGLWRQCIDRMLADEDPKKVVSFLNNAGIISIDDEKKVVHIGTSNEFMMLQIKKFFGKVLKKIVKEVYNDQYTADVVTFDLFHAGDHPLQLNLKKIVKVAKKNIVPSSDQKKYDPNAMGISLNPKYRFSNFVVGSYNQLAFSAAESVAQQPGVAHNPLFIYGNVGLGKTHLLHAIGDQIGKLHPSLNVVYMPTTTLIDSIIDSLRVNKLKNLLRKFDTVDVLMLDDIQFLAEKEKTQEIFHNIFNDFHHRNKQIILSSDRPPRELHLLEARLRSRFALGLVVDVKKADFETKLAILKSKLAEKDEQIDIELLEILARNVTDNIRELEGALNIILTRQKMLDRDLSDSDVVEALSTLGYDIYDNGLASQKDISERNLSSVKHYDTVVAFVASYYNIPKVDILGSKRTKDVSLARQMLMYIAKHFFNWTLEKIGDYFGGKNHSSVIYSISTFEKRLRHDDTVKNDFLVIREEL